MAPLHLSVAGDLGVPVPDKAAGAQDTSPAPGTAPSPRPTARPRCQHYGTALLPQGRAAHGHPVPGGPRCGPLVLLTALLLTLSTCTHTRARRRHEGARASRLGGLCPCQDKAEA